MSRRRGLLLLAAAALLLSACSRSSSRRAKKPPPPPPPLPQATLVLGHATLTESLTDARGIRPGGLTGLHFDGAVLYLTDSSNHRVLAFDAVPSTNFAGADRVLGQTALNLDQPNTGGVSAATLRQPAGVYSNAQRVFVCDSQKASVDRSAACSWLATPVTEWATFSSCDEP